MGAAAALFGLFAVLCGCRIVPLPTRARQASTPEARMQATMSVAFKAGFRTEAQLLAATSIAIAESSLRADARNWHPEYGFRPKSDVLGVAGGAAVNSPDGSQLHSDRGTWQISSHAWPQYTDAQCDDPVQAAGLAFAISEHGTDFSPWDPYKAGTAQSHYDRSIDGWSAVRPMVRSFLADHPR